MTGLSFDQRCKEDVYHRDTYRRTGRGSSGFSMHYNLSRCTRRAGPDGYCYQHPYNRAYQMPDGTWKKKP